MNDPAAPARRPARVFRNRAAAAVVALMIGCLNLPGCGRTPAEPLPDELRIVTLSPAVTQMIADLGRSDSIVGITDHDRSGPAGAVVVGNYLDLNHERLVTLRPTHVVAMASRGVVSPTLLALAERRGFEVVAYPYPQTLADVAAKVDGGLGEAPGLGSLLRADETARRLRMAFDRFFDELQQITATDQPPRVLVVIGLGPLMASGPGTVHDELLRRAGGRNAAEAAAVTAPTFDREAVLAMNPQVVVILSPGRRSAREDPLTVPPELAQLPIDAVRDGRVAVVSDPAAMLPSTALPRVAAAIAAAMFPDRAAPIAAALSRYEEAAGVPTADR